MSILPPNFSLWITIALTTFMMCSAKILEITNKNLPNVLKSQPILILYHHPDCQYSSSYKQHYLNAHAYNDLEVEHVGVVDCSQELALCKKHNISEYPALRKISQDASIEVVNAELQMGLANQDYQQKDQYSTAKLAHLLKTSPNFVVVLFEEEGMPVLEHQRPKTSPYYDRIYYLSEGRLAMTLAGFVNHKPGCWILQLTDELNGQLSKYYCGDTYQSPVNLAKSIQDYVKKLSGAQPIQLSPQQFALVDNSNYENQTILGYKQLVYWVKNYEMQLEISTHSKISMCNYIYVWSSKCAHCDYEIDMKMIRTIVSKAYKEHPDQEVYTKKKLHSYDVAHNKLLFSESEVRSVAGLNQGGQVKKDQFHLVPNLIVMCFATSNSRSLQENVSLNIYKMDRIIATEIVTQFVDQVIDKQYGLAKGETRNKIEDSREEL